MTKPRLVVLGTGFAAFSLVKAIDLNLYDLTIISPRNHFLFTPLLPSTTVGTIEFRSIIEPIRTARKGIHYYQAHCTGIDPERKSVLCEQATDRQQFTLEYDLLVIAVGAVSNTFNIPGVDIHGLFLRELADARAIRQDIIDCLEQASIPSITEEERLRLLHFVVVGGGPTGVEFAAEMHDFLEEDLAKSYPQLRKDIRITILEATDQLLSTFDATLGSYTIQHFRRQRIEVRTGSVVSQVDKDIIRLKDGTNIPFGLLVWATGNGPTALVQSSPLPKERGRLITDEYFRLTGHSDIYAIGDCATMQGQNLPATAQVAQQEGKYLGRSLNRLAAKKDVDPFKYKNLGMLAYIGSNQALADLAAVKGRGYATYIFWRSAYLTRLVSLKNKTLVLFDWIKTRLFGRDISRF